MSDRHVTRKDNLEYDSSAKCYVRSPTFQTCFLRPNADRYLAQLRAIDAGIINLPDTWIGSPPAVDAMPVPSRRVNADYLREILGVIRERKSIECHYQSMSKDRPDPIWRRLTPHALGFDDARCHVRAFCHITNEFNDFVLSRISGLRRPGEAGSSAESDIRWNTFLDLILEPNPALSAGQQKVVAMEYAMKGGQAHMRVRHALLHYVSRRLRLDLNNTEKEPASSPIVVVNRLELSRVLESMRRLPVEKKRQQ